MILNLNDYKFSEVLLFGNPSFNNTKHTSILNTKIEYIASSTRFHVSLVTTNLYIHAWLFYLEFIIFIFIFSFQFSFFIKLLPIIIDLVFTLFYHVTIKYDFWYSDCFYPFYLLIYVFRVKKGFHISSNEINIRSR